MKLTKEECLEALNELYGELFFKSECGVGTSECITEPLKEVFENLINEHFELIKAIEFIFGVNSEEVLKEYMEKCVVSEDER